jgi:hypothetical protein
MHLFLAVHVTTWSWAHIWWTFDFILKIGCNKLQPLLHPLLVWPRPVPSTPNSGLCSFFCSREPDRHRRPWLPAACYRHSTTSESDILAADLPLRRPPRNPNLCIFIEMLSVYSLKWSLYIHWNAFCIFIEVLSVYSLKCSLYIHWNALCIFIEMLFVYSFKWYIYSLKCSMYIHW